MRSITLSQLAFYTSRENAGILDLRDFRRVVLEIARAVALGFRYLSQLRSFALADDVTGLYNRRGFLVLGLQNLKIACKDTDTAEVYRYLAR